MKKTLLVIGNVTFHYFGEEELKLFKNPTGTKKALVHEIECVVECDSDEEAAKLGEDALCICCDSYVIPSVFEKGIVGVVGVVGGVKGEVAYECENNLRAISVSTFKKFYLK